MALYDREYINNSQTSNAYTQEEQRVKLSTFIRQTYQLFAASLLAGSVGAYIGLGMAEAIRSWYWGLVILEFGALIGLYFAKKKAGLNLILLFAFTFLSGITLAPLLTNILGLAGGGAIIANSFMLTTVAFGGLSVFAMNTKRDFSAMGKMLFITLIVVVVASLINIFVSDIVMRSLLMFPF